MRKIFIVDDNRHLLWYLEKELHNAGHEVITAAAGLSAVKMLADYTPDVIFIDYFLPNLNGDKLCHIIRKMEHLKNAYVVIMSAAASELQLEPSSVGANALIAKGTFKETVKYLFSAIKDAETPFSAKPGDRIMGLDSVHPRQMTKELLGQNRHLQTMLDSISEGIVEIYCERVVYANPAAVTLLGKSQEQLLTAYPPDLFDRPARSQIESLMRSDVRVTSKIELNHLIQFEERILSIKKLPFQGDADTIILVITDVTERMRAEEELSNYQNHLETLVEERTADLKHANERLQRVQKMEAFGTIAGGVAHDLNNILSGIVSYPDLLLIQLPEDSPLTKPILTIKKSGDKAAAIVQDLLTLARRGVAIMDVVNLNDIIFEYLKSPEHEKLKSFNPDVEVKTDFAEDLLNISGSTVHLSKTVMNLVSNAAEAMTGGGSILLSTENRYIDSPVRGYDDIEEGDYVILEVSDSGMGIPSEDLERIFEPFYTKKKMGKSGTGLGMAVVWGTVKDHEGYIDVQSIEGKGTTFTLYFPATRQQSAKDQPSLRIEDYAGQGESILVVDDVKNQRDIASSILSELGYLVTTVSSGEEAVEYLQNNSADLIVLDMIMDTGIDGLDTYKRILELHPGQKAIITSGFSETERVKEAQKLGAGQYIKKPYTLEKIGLTLKIELGK